MSMASGDLFNTYLSAGSGITIGDTIAFPSMSIDTLNSDELQSVRTMMATYKAMANRLCIIIVDEKEEELHEKYPTLLKAYESYKDVSDTVRGYDCPQDLIDAYENYLILRALLLGCNRVD